MLENINSTEEYRKMHFIVDGGYDYFTSINSPEFVYEISTALEKIQPPFNQEEMAEITFVKCYDWTEANSQWFITLTDRSKNHYIYFFETGVGMERPVISGIKQDKDYFYRLAENLYRSGGCKDKNEDYITIGKIIGSKFVSYFSSQTYHRMDMIIFNDLLDAIAN
ncbi:MAG TPA: hypothetical protein PKE64_31040 [Anaerolineae bacterium]|nr:hypothetical protein [Anaerolineae bacterium]